MQVPVRDAVGDGGTQLFQGFGQDRRGADAVAVVVPVHRDGIAGGDGSGLVFKKGEIVRKVKEEELFDALMEEIARL